MVKLWKYFKDNILKIGISFLLIFIAWYPKLPSINVPHTWVYVRLEDFFIFIVVAIWFLQLIFKKVKLPPKIWTPFVLYWGAGLLSLVFSLIYIGPHLANFFPSIAAFYYVRHIEYLILFFVAFSSVKKKEDLKDYLLILSVTVVGFSLYAFGQRFYLEVWGWFPKFFEKFPFCFPSFQTGNEEFAKGIPLCLPKDARITSTFAGHYDLAAYLVVVAPIFTALIFVLRKRLNQILAFLLTLISITVLIFTSSRVSFIAYLLGMSLALIFLHRKKFIPLFFILSIILLLVFSGSTAKRFLETFRFANVVTNNQGQVVGELPDDLKNRVSDVIANVPTQNLPAGSGFLGLPQTNAPKKTDKALIQSALSLEQARRLKLENGGVEISTVSGSFLVKKVLVYDISFTTRFQAEWPNAWNAMLRNPLLGSGFATITLAADNNFLRILGETGLLGMVAFLSIFFALALILKQALPTINDKLSKGFILGLTGGVLGLFFNAILIDVFEASKVAETLWILLGIAVGTIFLYKKDFIYKNKIIKTLQSNFFVIFYLFFIFLIFFIKSLGNFFVADDFTWLKWAATTNLQDIPKLFINSQGFFYRPLAKELMFFLYTLYSFGFQWYHLSILLIHFLIGVAVYIIIQKLFKRKLLSFIGAFIFLFLPSQAENVFWISTLSINLSTLFIAYMLIFWMNFKDKKSKFNYTLALLFGVFSLLSYEGAIIILPLLILFDLFITKTKFKIKTLYSYIPFFLITAVYPVVRFAANSLPPSGDYSYNLSRLIPNTIGNFIGYLGVFIIGEPFLSVYSASRALLKSQSVLIGVILIIILLLVIVLIILKRRAFRKAFQNKDLSLAVFSILFIFVALIPFLGLGNIAQRYGYLASIGFAVLVVIVFKTVAGFVHKTNYKTYLLILLTVIVGGWYYYQNGIVNAEWKEAGRITNRTLGYLRLYYDGDHHDSNFYFVNPPIRKAQAWIFPVGLSDGIWFIYRDDSINIYKLSSLEEGRAMLQQKSKTNSVFAFDKNDNIYAIK